MGKKITIEKGTSQVTVMVRFEVEPANNQRLIELIMQHLHLFTKQPGFLSASLHNSTDGTRVVQYLQWETLEHHLACLNNEEIARDTQGFMTFIESGNANMEVQVFDVVFTAFQE